MFTYELVLAALADPTRRALYERVRERPRSVGELTGTVDITQPAVSQHLRVLREAGLVRSRKDGARRIYHPAPDGIRELRRYVETLWDDVLDAFKEAQDAGKVHANDPKESDA